MRLVKFVGKSEDSHKYTACEFMCATSESELERQFLEWITHFQLNIDSSFWTIGINKGCL